MAASQVNLPALAEIKQHILSETKNTKINEDVSKYMKTLIPKHDLQMDKNRAKEWLKWAKTIKDIKITRTPVPVAILPHGYKGELIDIKVKSPRCPDDKIYDENEKIRQRIARGNCFLNIENGPHNGTTCILYGLKKFTGGLGDDDDRDRGDNSTWKKYFTKPLDSTKNIIATKKANGEAAHFSCQMIDGQFVMCGGSKNVHLIFRRKDDISRYTDIRYTIAREVCEAIMSTLELMEPNERRLLLCFLSITRFTAVLEILSPDHQHVENLSHLQQNELQFIAWTETNIDTNSDRKLCTIPPHVGIEIARALKLPTVDYDVILMSNLDAHMIKIRQGYKNEGEVLYFIDETLSVIGLLKKKTIWYILCRATREKIRGAVIAYSKLPESFSISKYINRLEKRLEEIQSWLGLDREGLAHWKSLSVRFLRWTIQRLENGTATDMEDKFPLLWLDYLEETQSIDNINFKWKEPGDSDD